MSGFLIELLTLSPT